MEIPDSNIGWGITLLGVIVAWLVRLEARLNARPTREEQEISAAKVAHVMRIDFEEIKRMLEKQNESALLHRQWVGDSLAEIRTKVAVLRARAGEDPHDEEHRRRS